MSGKQAKKNRSAFLWEGPLREGAPATRVEENACAKGNACYIVTQAPCASYTLGTSLSEGGLKKDDPFTGSR